MDKRTIALGISFERAEVLYNVCDELKDIFAPRNEHELLLYQYMMELHYKLHTMLQRKQERYVLRLSASESEAFFQLWNMMDLSRHKYAQIVVDSIFQKMSA
jgi:hypothetical protein